MEQGPELTVEGLTKCQTSLSNYTACHQLRIRHPTALGISDSFLPHPHWVPVWEEEIPQVPQSPFGLVILARVGSRNRCDLEVQMATHTWRMSLGVSLRPGLQASQCRVRAL